MTQSHDPNVTKQESLKEAFEQGIDNLANSIANKSINATTAFTTLKNILLTEKPTANLDERRVLETLLLNQAFHEKLYNLFLQLKVLLLEELENFKPSDTAEFNQLYQYILNYNFLYQQSILKPQDTVPEMIRRAATVFLLWKIQSPNFKPDPNNQWAQSFFNTCGPYFLTQYDSDLFTADNLIELLKAALQLQTQSINIPNLINLIIEAKPKDLNVYLQKNGLSLLGLALLYNNKGLVEKLLSKGASVSEDVTEILEKKPLDIEKAFGMLADIEKGILTKEDLEKFHLLCLESFPTLDRVVKKALNRIKNRESLNAITVDFINEFKSNLINIKQTHAEINQLATHKLFDPANEIQFGNDEFVSVKQFRIEPLGKGVFGEVFRAQFIPRYKEDPFLPFCREIILNGNPTYWVAIKNPQQIDDKEFAGEQKSVNGLTFNESTNYNNARPATIVNKDTKNEVLPLILSQFEYYEIENDLPKSSNVESYLKKEIAKDNENTKITNFFNKRGPEMGNILAGAYKGMQEIHQQGLLHYDLAFRNILLAKNEVEGNFQAKLADFGKSVNANDPRELGNAAPTNDDRYPMRLMDPSRFDFINYKQNHTADEIAAKKSPVNKTSEYYSFRIMMLEWFAAELSKTLHTVQNNLSDAQIYYKMLALRDNPQGLRDFLEKEYLATVKRYTEEAPDSVKQIIQVLLNSFADYFINVPTFPDDKDPGKSLDQILQEDENQLKDAFKKYFIQLLNHHVDLLAAAAQDNVKFQSAFDDFKTAIPYLLGFNLDETDFDPKYHRIFQVLRNPNLLDNTDELNNFNVLLKSAQLEVFAIEAAASFPTVSATAFNTLQYYQNYFTGIESTYKKDLDLVTGLLITNPSIEDWKKIETNAEQSHLEELNQLKEKIAQFGNDNPRLSKQINGLIEDITKLSNKITIEDALTWQNANTQRKKTLDKEILQTYEAYTKYHANYVTLLAAYQANRKNFTRVNFGQVLHLISLMQNTLAELVDLGFDTKKMQADLQNDKEKIWQKEGTKSKYKIIWDEFKSTDIFTETHLAALPKEPRDKSASKQTEVLNNVLHTTQTLLGLYPLSREKLSKNLGKDFEKDRDPKKREANFGERLEVRALLAFKEAYKEAQLVFKQDLKIKNNLDLKTLIALAALQGQELNEFADVRALANDHKEIEKLETLAEEYENLINKASLPARPRSGKGIVAPDAQQQELLRLTQQLNSIPPFGYEALQNFACARDTNGNPQLKNDLITEFSDRYANCIDAWTDYFINLDQQSVMYATSIFEQDTDNNAADMLKARLLESINFLVDKISNFILADLASRQGLAERTMALEFWINVASRCLIHPQVKSINSAEAIFDALKTPEIQNLHRSFHGLSTDANHKLNKLETLFSHKHHYRALQRFMAKNQNVTPSFTFYLADLNRLEKRKKRQTYKKSLTSYAPARKLLHEFISASTHSTQVKFSAKTHVQEISAIEINQPSIAQVKGQLNNLAASERNKAKARSANNPIEPEPQPIIVKQIAPALKQALAENAAAELKRALAENAKVKKPIVETVTQPTSAFSFGSNDNEDKFLPLLQKQFESWYPDAISERGISFVEFSDHIFDKVATQPALINFLGALYNLTRHPLPETTDDIIATNKIQICNDILDHLSENELLSLRLFLLREDQLKKALPSQVLEHIEHLTDPKTLRFHDHYPTKLELGQKLADNYKDITEFLFKEKKEGGLTGAGEHGGRRTIQYYAPNPGQSGPLVLHTQTILFKQDTQGEGEKKKVRHANVMAEFFAGAIKNALAGDGTATVFLVRAPTVNADGSITYAPNDNYIGSVYYDGFTEMFKHMELTERAHTIFGKKFVAGTEVRYADEYNAAMSEYDQDGNLVCRFTDFDNVVSTCLLAGDFDLNIGNLGTTPIENSDKERLVDIDHGAGLRKLSPKVHMHSLSEHLPGNGPNNHFYNIPRELKINANFADELDKKAQVDLSSVIEASVDKLNEFYDRDKLLLFASYVGLSTKTFEAYTKEQLVTELKRYLKETFQKRQESCQELANEIRLSLCLTKNTAGEWELNRGPIEYKDPEGNQKQFTLMEQILARPEYFLTGEYHFRSRDQAWNFLNTGIRVHWPTRATLTAKVNDYIFNNLNPIVDEAVKQQNPKFLEYLLTNRNLYTMLKEDKNKFTRVCDSYQIILKDIAKQLESVSRQAYLTHDPRIRHNITENIHNTVCNDIMSEKNTNNRTLVFERWIKIMAECYANKDFNSVLAIMAAFIEKPVRDLKTHFEKLPEREDSFFLKMKELFCDATFQFNRDKIADFMLYEMDKEKQQSKLAEDAKKIAQAAGAKSFIEPDAQAKPVMIPAVDYLEKRLAVDMNPQPNLYNGLYYDYDKIENLHENVYQRNFVATGRDAEVTAPTDKKRNLSYEELAQDHTNLKKTYDGVALEKETARSNHFSRSQPTFSEKIKLPITDRDLPKKRRAPQADLEQSGSLQEEVEKLIRLCQDIGDGLNHLSKQDFSAVATGQSLFARKVVTPLIPGGAPLMPLAPTIKVES